MDYRDAAAAGPVQISRKLCSPVFSAIARRSDMMPGFVKIAGNADLRFSGLQISCLRKKVVCFQFRKTSEIGGRSGRNCSLRGMLGQKQSRKCSKSGSVLLNIVDKLLPFLVDPCPENAVMTDHASHETTAAHADAPLFSAVEVEQFSADDVTAGSAIGKMLSALFLYTVVAMSIASWWTWSSITAATAARLPSAKETAAHDHDHQQHAPAAEKAAPVEASPAADSKAP